MTGSLQPGSARGYPSQEKSLQPGELPRPLTRNELVGCSTSLAAYFRGGLSAGNARIHQVDNTLDAVSRHSVM